MRALASHSSVLAYDAYWTTFRRRFGKLSLALAKSVRSSAGRLMATERVRDPEEEERAARAQDRRKHEDADVPSLCDAGSIRSRPTAMVCSPGGR